VVLLVVAGAGLFALLVLADRLIRRGLSVRAVIDFLDEYIFFFLAVAAVTLAVVWYLNVYDTAQGKCQRGDPQACLIWQAQQAPAP